VAELSQTAAGPVLACLVFESDTAHIRGISEAGHWEALLNAEHAVPDAARAAATWADHAGLPADTKQIEKILSSPWKPQVQEGFFALLAALGIPDPGPEPES
jgi:hypothetical protein